MGATVTLRILGSGDPFGSGGRKQSGYFLKAGARGILLDCGASTVASLKGLGVDASEVELVLLTHFHADHLAGLPFLYHDYQHVTARPAPLVVAGPPGVRARVEGIYRTLHPGSASAKRRFRVRYRVLSPGRLFRPPGMTGVRVIPFRVRHSTPGSSLGYRVAIGGRRLVYTGDTGWFPQLPRATRGAHLLLCECTFRAKAPAGHLSLSELLAHRRSLGARRILLTHLGPELADLRRLHGFRLARDGMRVRV